MRRLEHMFEHAIGKHAVRRQASPLVGALDDAHRQVGEAHRKLLSLVAEMERRAAWKDQGARDAAHWLAMRYGISEWKARRWIGAAHAPEELPPTLQAVARGAR